MINVAIIGYGNMGKNHARVLSDIENVKISGIVDDMEENRTYAERKFDCRVYADHRELLEKESIDLVVVATPTKTHRDIALDVLSAGCHCLVEKPIASSVAAGQDMAELAGKKDVILTVGHVERFNPAIQLLKSKLDRFECGRVFKIEVNRAGPFPHRIRDVGVIVDLAVHDIDIISYLTGKKAVKVYAQTEKKIHTDHEDLLTAIITYESNIIALFNTNWLTPFKVRNLSVTGEKGLFHVDFLYQTLRFYENADIDRRFTYTEMIRGVSEGAMIQYPVNKQEPLKLQAMNIINAIQKGERPSVSPEDANTTLRVAFSLIEASETGTAIRLGE